MSTGVGVVILLEAVALIVWVILALGYDQRIKAWEDRTARRFRRWLCERWLNRGDLEAVRAPQLKMNNEK